MENNKNFDLYTTLIIIYLALLTVCIALYALIQIYVEDKGTATNLMIWSATLFPSIALLYTFNSWREQKSSDVLSELSKDMFFKLNKIIDINENILNDHRDKILNKRLKNIDLFFEDSETDLTKNLTKSVNEIIDIGFLVYKYTKNEEFRKKINRFNDAYLYYRLTRQEIYMGMKSLDDNRSVAINKNDDNEYLTNIKKVNECSNNLHESNIQLSTILLDYIFHQKMDQGTQ